MELLYFTDISQVDYLVQHTPELLTQKLPITGDIVVAYQLEKLGIEFIDEWDFLEPDDITRHYQLAHLLSTTWWDENLASTEYEGFALSNTAQQDMIYALEACLNARAVYQRIFSTYQIEKISGYFIPPTGVIRTGPRPTHRAVRSVTQAILFYLAEKQGVSVIKLDTGRPLSSGLIATKRRVLSPVKSTELTKTTETPDKVVLIYEDGMSFEELTVLLEVFNKFPKIKVISISQQVLELGLQPYTLQSGGKHRLQSFWDKFIDSINKYQGEYPEIFANSHLLFQFECIWNEMKIAADLGDVYATFLDLLKPALVVFGHEAFTKERTFVRLAESRKITSIGLMHGVVRPKFTYCGIIGDADLIMVANQIDVEGLVSYGIDKTKLHEVGCLKHKNSLLKNLADTEQNLVKAKKTAKKHLNLDPDKPLIMCITAAINAGFASPLASPRKHREAIRDFISLVLSRPDLQFVIKPHPNYDYYEIYRRLLDSKLPNLIFPEQVTLTELIAASDVGLMINYCTSAALETMLEQVPVVYLENAIYPLEDRHDNLSATAIYRVQTIAELEQCIDSLLTRPEVKSQALAKAQNELKNFLDINEDQGNGRLFTFINQVVYQQKTSNTYVLLNPQRMQEWLLSLNNKSVLPTCFSEQIEKHTGEHLMFVFAYLAGINNQGLASIEKIFIVFKNQIANENIKLLRKMRWLLLPAYITGKISKSAHNNGKLSTILSLRLYIRYPGKFISAPVLFKREVIKHFVKIMLGHTGISVLNWLLKNIYSFSNAFLQKK